MAAERRHTSSEDELANLRTIMHGLDNELLAKTMSLDQAMRVGFVVFFSRGRLCMQARYVLSQLD